MTSSLRTAPPALLAERALAAFQGLALGDALGMPTQSMSRATIEEDYGKITGFRDAGPRQRIAAGMPAGSVTDDTEQALLLAELLIESHGVIDPATFASRLLSWEAQMRAKGSLDLLGPSTKSALEQLNRGVPAAEAGSGGTTNGAAMRVTPVGIAVDASDLPAFVDAVVAASEVTHNTGIGIASAAAVGAAVSAGVGGATLEEALETALAAAVLGEQRGHWAAGGSIAGRLRWAIPYVRNLRPDLRQDALAEVIGTSVAAQESVVAALALTAISEDPWRTLCQAAGLGGDTDTIAAIAGAVLGATGGSDSWPATEVRALEAINHLDFGPIVEGLLHLRR